MTEWTWEEEQLKRLVSVKSLTDRHLDAHADSVNASQREGLCKPDTNSPSLTLISWLLLTYFQLSKHPASGRSTGPLHHSTHLLFVLMSEYTFLPQPSSLAFLSPPLQQLPCLVSSPLLQQASWTVDVIESNGNWGSLVVGIFCKQQQLSSIANVLYKLERRSLAPRKHP